MSNAKLEHETKAIHAVFEEREPQIRLSGTFGSQREAPILLMRHEIDYKNRSRDGLYKRVRRSSRVIRVEVSLFCLLLIHRVTTRSSNRKHRFCHYGRLKAPWHLERVA